MIGWSKTTRVKGACLIWDEIKKASPWHSSRSKVGQTLSEETSRVASEVQIVRAQEGECRQVIVNLLPFLVCLCKTPTFDSELMLVFFNNFCCRWSRRKVSSCEPVSAESRRGERGWSCVPRQFITYSSNYDKLTVCSKWPFQHSIPSENEGRSQVKRAGDEGKRLAEANRRVKIKVESLRQAASSARWVYKFYSSHLMRYVANC